MKQVLVQLDTDPHPSPFDAIAAYDAGVDVVLAYGGVTPEDVPDLVQGAMFPRGPKGLVNTAVWVGGGNVRDGEAVFAAVQEVFFDPFRLSVMLDSDGCTTTAAAGVARVRSAVALDGARVVVVGVGPVGLRSAQLLRDEGADVLVSGLPPDVFAGEFRRARGLDTAKELGFALVEPESSDELHGHLDGAAVVLAAAPAGMQVLAEAAWKDRDGLEVVVDYSATEPVGIEGVGSTDDLEEKGGAKVLGALAVGAPKMTVQKTCVRRLFAEPGQVLDTAAVYAAALESDAA